jgi:hypothetical protein
VKLAGLWRLGILRLAADALHEIAIGHAGTHQIARLVIAIIDYCQVASGV